MRHLILHIGSHKTGTTALQQWLGGNATILASRGLGYLRSGGEPHAHRLLSQVDPERSLPGGHRVHNPQKFAEALSELPQDTVVVSSENFSFFLDPETIKTLADTVKPMFDKVSVVCYLRRQDRQAASHHMEGARADRRTEWELWGHGFKALPERNSYQPLYLNYFNRMKMWADQFGAESLVVRVFDRNHLVNGDIVADFTQVMGIDRTDCTKSKDVNTSLDRVKSRMGHMANVIGGREILTRTLLVSTKNTEALLRPTKAEARAFLAPYRASNAQLNAWLKVNDLPELFPDDFDDLPDVAPSDWTDEEFTRAMRGAITTLARMTHETAMPTYADLRAAAQALAQTEPHRALRLVEAALAQRPKAKVMWAMQAELEAFIKSGRASPLTDYSDADED
jgi:hypothetical protein